jgi:hypothetical protein
MDMTVARRVLRAYDYRILPVSLDTPWSKLKLADGDDHVPVLGT